MPSSFNKFAENVYMGNLKLETEMVKNELVSEKATTVNLDEFEIPAEHN